MTGLVRIDTLPFGVRGTWTQFGWCVVLCACASDPPLVPAEVDPADNQVTERSTEKPAGQRIEVPTGEDPDFHVMMDVLTHPRCVNCHPNDAVPKQTDRARPHRFGVHGGPHNHGIAALQCEMCHQESNNDDSGVPGAPEWSLAPASMAWEGLDRYEIARSMLNPEHNGNRSHEEVRHHLTEHALVLWAWEPGVDADGVSREPPPVPVEEYKEAVNRWFERGAKVPGQR